MAVYSRSIVVKDKIALHIRIIKKRFTSTQFKESQTHALTLVPLGILKLVMLTLAGRHLKFFYIEYQVYNRQTQIKLKEKCSNMVL